MRSATSTLFSIGLLAALAGVSGCGGGQTAAPAPAPVAQPVLVTDNSGARLLALAGNPKCGIDLHHFEYGAVGAAGEASTASGALMVPTGSDPACGGKRPVLMYGHGSSLVKNVNLVDLSPAAPYGSTAVTVAALFAAQGYIVVAPNYAGFDTSTLNYPPHHIAEQQGRT